MKQAIQKILSTWRGFLASLLPKKPHPNLRLLHRILTKLVQCLCALNVSLNFCPFHISQTSFYSAAAFPSSSEEGDTSSSRSEPSASGIGMSHKDFENIVLMRMRQAQERKRLAQQIMEEDKDKT
jgi:hypothetical protein